MQHRNNGIEIASERNTIVNKLFGLRRSVLIGLALTATALSLTATTAPSAFAAGQPHTYSSQGHFSQPGRHVSSKRPNWYAVFAGTWIGRPFGDAGRCGSAYGQLITTARQSVIYSQRSTDCAGFTAWGKFWVSGSYIRTHWTGNDCAPGCSSDYWTTEWFRVLNLNTIQYCDSGQCYLYHRVKH
jgi:hypothetical protein